MLRFRTSAFLSIAVCGLLLLSGCDALGSDSNLPEGQIGYTDTEGTIYVMDLPSRTVRRLAHTQAIYIRWSPDGNRIAYVGRNGNRITNQTFVVNTDGTGRRAVALWEYKGRLEPHPGGGRSPVWAPDGERIAFTRCTNCEVGGGNTEVFIVDLDTTGGLKEVRLTENLLSDGVQDWSPDGERLLIQSDYAPDGSWDRYGDIYEMDPDGSNRRLVLVNDTTLGIFTARYSPDGAQIAFIGGIGAGENGYNEIFVANADGSAIRQVTDNNVNESSVSWSPDGQWLLFGATKGSIADGVHVYVIKVDGTEQQRLTSGAPRYESTEWRPHPP